MHRWLRRLFGPPAPPRPASHGPPHRLPSRLDTPRARPVLRDLDPSQRAQPLRCGPISAGPVVRLLAIADTDAIVLPPLPPIDVLVGLGDCAAGTVVEAARQTGAARVLLVRGNHDAAAPVPAPLVGLHRLRLTTHGLVWTGLDGCLRYKEGGIHQYTPAQYADWIRALPPADVLLTHAPAAGVHDDPPSRTHAGLPGLAEAYSRRGVRLHLHGHMHHDRVSAVGATTVVGVYGWRVLEVPIEA